MPERNELRTNADQHASRPDPEKLEKHYESEETSFFDFARLTLESVRAIAFRPEKNEDAAHPYLGAPPHWPVHNEGDHQFTGIDCAAVGGTAAFSAKGVSKMEASGTARGVVSDKSFCDAKGHSTVDARGHATVVASENATVHASDNARVSITKTKEASKVTATGTGKSIIDAASGTVTAKGECTVTIPANGDAVVNVVEGKPLIEAKSGTVNLNGGDAVVIASGRCKVKVVSGTVIVTDATVVVEVAGKDAKVIVKRELPISEKITGEFKGNVRQEFSDHVGKLVESKREAQSGQAPKESIHRTLIDKYKDAIREHLSGKRATTVAGGAITDGIVKFGRRQVKIEINQVQWPGDVSFQLKTDPAQHYSIRALEQLLNEERNGEKSLKLLELKTAIESGAKPVLEALTTAVFEKARQDRADRAASRPRTESKLSEREPSAKRVEVPEGDTARAKIYDAYRQAIAEHLDGKLPAAREQRFTDKKVALEVEDSSGQRSIRLENERVNGVTKQKLLFRAENGCDFDFGYAHAYRQKAAAMAQDNPNLLTAEHKELERFWTSRRGEQAHEQAMIHQRVNERALQILLEQGTETLIGEDRASRSYSSRHEAEVDKAGSSADSGKSIDAPQKKLIQEAEKEWREKHNGAPVPSGYSEKFLSCMETALDRIAQQDRSSAAAMRKIIDAYKLEISAPGKVSEHILQIAKESGIATDNNTDPAGADRKLSLGYEPIISADPARVVAEKLARIVVTANGIHDRPVVDMFSKEGEPLKEKLIEALEGHSKEIDEKIRQRDGVPTKEEKAYLEALKQTKTVLVEKGKLPESLCAELTRSRAKSGGEPINTAIGILAIGSAALSWWAANRTSDTQGVPPLPAGL